MTFKVYERNRKLKTIRCDVSGAEYNRLQRARNCISDAVSRMGCEERGTSFKRRRVEVNCASKKFWEGK